MTNIVFDIQRFCINDGPGIRTTVFFKGCMLNCLWCHNPESKSPTPTLMYHKEKCINCGKCIELCSLHKIENNQHIIDRTKCDVCGKCVSNCLGALEICGKQMNVSEIVKEILKDKEFYQASNGGITLSGGEPLLNISFIKELLEEAKKHNIHTCIETCGHVNFYYFEKIKEYVDIFLYDIKETDAVLHQKYTGVDNKLILENLYKLNQIGSKIILRCPIIPGLNDRIEHLKEIAKIANELENVLEIHIEPYHPMGKNKSESIGTKYLLSNLNFVEEETVNQWIYEIKNHTNKPVKKQ